LEEKEKGEEQKIIQQLPDILCAIQVSLEGGITKNVIENNTDRAFRSAGDLIP